MRVICIHPRFAALTSHHFNESQGLIEELSRRGDSFELLVSVHAPAEIVAELDAHAVLDDPTFRMEWSFEERSDRFLAMLHEHLDERARAGDRVLITVSTQLEAHALTRWLAGRPRGRKPWVVILFASDRWNRSGEAERARQLTEFHKLNAVIASLSPADRQRLILLTLTDLLATELTGLLGSPVGVAPMPLPYADPREYSSPKPAEGALPRVAILGGMRAEKGSHLIPAVIRACRSLVPVEFLVHLTNNTLPPDAVERLAAVAGEPHVSVIDQPMSRSQYYAAIASADLGLFPYEVIPYRQRTSGVFGEMVAFGKPVVATRGTWLAEQIEAGRAAGTVFDDLEAESIARAVARCVDDLERLTQAAQALGPPWRRTGVPAFVELVEATIAERGRAAEAL